MELDHTKIDNIQFEGIDHRDSMDYCDAFICSADYDGEPMTDEQLQAIDPDWMYEKLLDHLF